MKLAVNAELLCSFSETIIAKWLKEKLGPLKSQLRELSPIKWRGVANMGAQIKHFTINTTLTKLTVRGGAVVALHFYNCWAQARFYYAIPTNREQGGTGTYRSSISKTKHLAINPSFASVTVGGSGGGGRHAFLKHFNPSRISLSLNNLLNCFN